MECSPNVEASKLYFIVIEKQILRDIAAGIFRELSDITSEIPPKRIYDHLRIIAAYADNLRNICE